MRVTSDRQTLILAGETPPRRAGVGSGRIAGALLDSPDDTEAPLDGDSSSRLTIISARVDAIVTHGTYTQILVPSGGGQLATLAGLPASLPSALPQLHQAYVVSNRGSSSAAANAYARTRDLADKAPAIIDTYA